MTMTVAIPTHAITHQNGELTTTSLKVAEAFGKQHCHVLKKLESLGCSAEFTSINFSIHEELIQAGAVKRLSKVYHMTKDGFMFLVMGFTGKQAAAMKEAYINEFNRMANALQSGHHHAASMTPRLANINRIANKVIGNALGMAECRNRSTSVSAMAEFSRLVTEQDELIDEYLAAMESYGIVRELQLFSTQAALIERAPTYSIESWYGRYPAFQHAQLQHNRVRLPQNLVYSMDCPSPSLSLFGDLSRHGADVSACRAEVLALKHYMGESRLMLESIRQQAETMNSMVMGLPR